MRKIKRKFNSSKKNEMYNFIQKLFVKIRNNALIELMNKKIIIIGGDPNSINSELIYKKLEKKLTNL